LKVKKIKTGNFVDRFSIGFMISPDLFISADAHCFDPVKNPFTEALQLLTRVFTRMPGVSAQRLTDVWGRNNCFASRFQDPVDFLQKQLVILDMLYDLKAHYCIIVI